MKEKIKLTFLKLFDNPLSKYFILKYYLNYYFKIFYFILHVMAILGYLPKLKRGLGLAFGAFFLHGFPIKIFLIEYSCHTFFVFKISNKMSC